jgi:DNA adenine methylase
MKPFLPWPGSKAKCADLIIEEFPQSFRTYHEPFLGSGAVFFGMYGKRAFHSARLSDRNRNLMRCWEGVMDMPHVTKVQVEHCLERNSEAFYKEMTQRMDAPGVFLYVMRAAFSSMYRENSKGEFNVPWRKGDFEVDGKVISFDTNQLLLCSGYLNSINTTLQVADWQDVIQAAVEGDVVYFDPPYLKATSNAFTSYQAGGFGEGDHVMLRTHARLLAERGVFVALSNSDCEASRRIYGEPYKRLKVTNAVKSTATTKGTRDEGLWIWRPIK